MVSVRVLSGLILGLQFAYSCGKLQCSLPTDFGPSGIRRRFDISCCETASFFCILWNFVFKHFSCLPTDLIMGASKLSDCIGIEKHGLRTV